MTGITITTTGTVFKVAFNDYSNVLNILNGTWPKINIKKIFIREDQTKVVVDVYDDKHWVLSHDGCVDILKIKYINGIIIANNLDLYDKLSSLI